MTNHAIIIETQGRAKLIENQFPKLRDEYLLIRVCAVAVNPTDWKHIDIFGSSSGYPDATVGCDYAGIVEEVGSKVEKTIRKGDRVCGMCHGSNALHHEAGAFQEHIVAKAAVSMIIPDDLSFTQAATLGVGITTAGQALYQSLRLPLPISPASSKQSILIYGGSTATGSLAIQLAKLSGLEVLTTCSPRNFDYVKKLGADATFDYQNPNCVDEIKKHTNDALQLVFDCVSSGGSTEITVKSMSSIGGIYTALDPVSQEKISSLNSNVESKTTLAYTALGERMSLGGTEIPAKTDDLQFAQSFWETARDLLSEGKLKVHRLSVNEGGKGLEGVLKGLQLGREGKVSGRKLVYTV